MKNILILIPFFLSINLIAQSELEKLVLIEINNYRESFKLPPASFDTIAYKAATHHSNWMFKVGWKKINELMSNKNDDVDAHMEIIDVPNFVEILDPLERGKKFGIPDNVFIAEICSLCRVNEGNPFKFKRLSDANLAKNIIEKFSMSPPHNEVLLLELNEGSKFSVGISSIIDDEIVFTTIYFIEELEE